VAQWQLPPLAQHLLAASIPWFDNRVSPAHSFLSPKPRPDELWLGSVITNRVR
jgi:hypothetical protein